MKPLTEKLDIYIPENDEVAISEVEALLVKLSCFTSARVGLNLGYAMHYKNLFGRIESHTQGDIDIAVQKLRGIDGVYVNEHPPEIKVALLTEQLEDAQDALQTLGDNHNAFATLLAQLCRTLRPDIAAIAPQGDAEMALWLIVEYGNDAHDELLAGAIPCG
ncbi:MAG: hypothetical protein F6K00_19460 [Leptolyngbya sp. SIOISBB]|nr:hypothetical protein [Leptolyngbya sp. SIOISBB]